MSHVSPAVRLGASLWLGLLAGIAATATSIAAGTAAATRMAETLGVVAPDGSGYMTRVDLTGPPEAQLAWHVGRQLAQCQHLVWVRASITGGYPNSHLDIDIQYPGLQHRTTYALTNFFNGVANKVQQQELKKNEQTAVPKLLGKAASCVWGHRIESSYALNLLRQMARDGDRF